VALREPLLADLEPRPPVARRALAQVVFPGLREERGRRYFVGTGRDELVELACCGPPSSKTSTSAENAPSAAWKWNARAAPHAGHSPNMKISSPPRSLMPLLRSKSPTAL
jgi:hypothetical protein